MAQSTPNTTGSERELKLALGDPAALADLLAALPPATWVLEQTNHYFLDPGGRLADVRVMVRVREETRCPGPGWVGSPPERSMHVVLTIKRRAASRDGYFQAEEREEVLPVPLWRRVQAGSLALTALPSALITELAREHQLTSLTEHAASRNLRRVVPLEGFTLELDHTTYPDGSDDCEVEVETDRPEQARALLLRVAASAGVRLTPQTKGKYARLRARLRAMPRGDG